MEALSPLVHRDLLLAVANVAAAFVGFSMVVGLLKTEVSASDLRFHTIRDVAEIGLIVIGAGLFPLTVYAYGVTPGTVWRLSSLLMTLAWLISFIFAQIRFRQAGSVALLDRNPVWAVMALGIVVAGNGLLWWNVATSGPLAGARYITSLLLLLTIAGVMFINATFRKGHGER